MSIYRLDTRQIFLNFYFVNRREDSQEVRGVSLSRGRTIAHSEGSSGNVRQTLFHDKVTLMTALLRGLQV